jgi:uroporphyrinogen decarboxylase
MMRQAGRILPDYRRLRERHSLQTCFKDPELAAAITLMPIQTLGVDAAIVFTDLLVVLESLGVPVAFREQAAPHVQVPENLSEWFKTLDRQPGPFEIVVQTVQRVKSHLQVPLIGFVGAPWTLLSYLVQGGSEGDRAKTLLMQDPELADQICQLLVDEAVAYCTLQVQAGAQVLQIFDSLAHLLDPFTYRERLVPFLKQLINRLKALQVPVILFARGSAGHRMALLQLECALSIDWADDMAWWANQTTHVLQGNLDPQLLAVAPQALEPRLDEIEQWARTRGGIICNLGHGLLPHTPFEHVRELTDRVREGAWSSC